jgi:acetyl esterase
MEFEEEQNTGAPLIEAEATVPTHYPLLSASDKEFLLELDRQPAIGELSVAKERERMRAGQSSPFESNDVVMTEFATSACPVRLIRPGTAPPSSPVFFLIHGGGWVLGDFETHGKLACEIAIRTSSVVAFIDYPRAPEHRFPNPLESCFTAMYEVLAAAQTLGIDPEYFALGGDSAGGNLAIALMLLAIKRKQPSPKRLVLLYPALDPSGASHSYQEFAQNPNLSQSTMHWFWQAYRSEHIEADDPRFSPLLTDSETLARFPPTLIITCEYDILRDEGEEFAARLIQAGVNMTAVRWLGTLHSFVVTERLAASPSAQMCIDFLAKYIQRGFEPFSQQH